MKPEFEEQKPNQRRTICEIIGELARGVDVHLVGDSDTLKWLIDSHRNELGVSSGFDAPPTSGSRSELVDDALGELNPDGREAEILWRLSDEATGALSYHSVYSGFHVRNSRIRQCINRLGHHLWTTE